MSLIDAAVTSKSNSSPSSSDSVTAAGNVPIGSAVLVVLQLRATVAPVFSSFADSAGNTYTVDGNDLVNSEIVVGRCGNTTAPIVGGTTTYGWSISAGTLTDANFIIVAFDAPLGAPPAIVSHQYSASTIDQSVTPAAIGDTALWIFALFGSTTKGTKSGNGAQAAFLHSTNRGLAVGYLSPTTSTATLTQGIQWSTIHSGASIGIDFPPAAGTAPTANAGTDQSVVAGTMVQLDGTGSTAGVAHNWTHVSGPSTLSMLSDPSIAKPTYTPTTSGVDVWRDTVTNSGGSSSDTVSVTATNRKPVAVITGPSTAAVGSSYTLDFTGSYDPDTGDTITYAVSGSGPNATGVTGTASSLTVNATSPGPDVWSLVVTDNHGQASDAVTFTVNVGASGVRIRINGQWIEAFCKIRVAGAWVQV